MTDPAPWETAVRDAVSSLPPDAYDVRDPMHPDNRPDRDPEFLRRREIASFLDGYADEATRREVVGATRAAILDVVRARSDERRRARIERLDGEDPASSTDLRRELVGAANDADVLTALASVFTAGATEAKGIAGDLLEELPKRNTARGPKPPASAKVGDGQGSELVLTRTQATKLSADLDEIVEIVVAHQVAGYDGVGGDADPRDVAAYAAGLREGIAALRAVLASPSCKSTALDALVKRLEDREEDDLAKRLRKAYGKVDVGEPAVKLERRELKVDDS